MGMAPSGPSSCVEQIPALSQALMSEDPQARARQSMDTDPLNAREHNLRVLRIILDLFGGGFPVYFG